ncbi:hypothetical protein DVA67_029975 [Solirubrobacter sp. CPCC 204708]|nr:hypothetical protein [Solirubrobacter deserti]
MLATFVAVMSSARISVEGGKPTLTYREQEVWASASTLLITQAGFPWGRAILDDMIQVDSGTDDPILIPKYGDPGRYSGLAGLYAELAKSDEVQAEVMKNSKPGESVVPMVVQPPGTNSTLPLITMKGLGPTPESAMDVAMRSSKAFREFLDRQQAASNIPKDKRVEVVVTQKATNPELFEKRSMVRPIFLFLLINIGFLALAFALENLRPRSKRKGPPAPRQGDAPTEEHWAERERHQVAA